MAHWRRLDIALEARPGLLVMSEIGERLVMCAGALERSDISGPPVQNAPAAFDQLPSSAEFRGGLFCRVEFASTSEGR